MDWAIPDAERQKYTSVFLQLSENDQNAKLSGALVRPILMKSNLDITKLGKIWTLSDIDKDGNLDMDEFIVAMYLVYKSLTDGYDPPESLPQNIVPPSKRPKSVPPSRPPPPAGPNYGALSGLTLDNPTGFSAFDATPKALGAPPAAPLPTETLITPPTPAFSADFGSFGASQPELQIC
jgi:epidermal growth factor receptor substrate 15